MIVTSSTLEVEENSILVYPNPNKGEFNIFLSKKLYNAHIQLIDSIGKEYVLVNTDGFVKANGLVKGVYILIVSKGENRITKKIMVD